MRGTTTRITNSAFSVADATARSDGPHTPTLPADSAVVDSDPLSIDREKLDPIRTEATVIDGEVVFGGL
jgi:predicted amidohydrolase YtcJ